MSNKIRNSKFEIGSKLEILNDQNSKRFWSLEFGTYRFLSCFGFRASNFSPNGQIAVVLLLFVLVALTIGLAVTQRSLSSITSSNQNEQSTRAFTAAEAGIEKNIDSINGIKITDPTSLPNNIALGNQSQATVKVVTQLPKTGQALEYPPIGKDTIAQFWLADPVNPQTPALGYQGSKVNVYFGKGGIIPIGETAPAIEVNLIYRDNSVSPAVYVSTRTFFDSVSTRTASNLFTYPGAANCSSPTIKTSLSLNPITSLQPDDRSFACQVSVNIPASSNPMMLRIRVLYSDIKQPIAVAPVGNCGLSACSLPQQAAIYSSTGSSGQSQKTLQVFRETNFLPSFLDFAIFSSGKIEKQ